MINFFDKSLHYLGRNLNDTFVLNIGAMDGVMFDEMIGYTKMYNFKGLYVEPIPYLFEKLKSNIGEDNLFENSAISDYDGSIEMITIDREAIDQGLVHDCFYGMSAVYPPKNGLGSEFDKPTVDKYGSKIIVPCITFSTLLKKHNLTNIDVVKIDAEGHDYQIFKQIDLKLLRPKVIRLEWVNLSENVQNNILNTFSEHDYITEISGQDIVGVTKEFYNEILNIGKSDESIPTFVTGLWDIGRGELTENWSRNFDHYLNKFKELLNLDINLIIFGNEKLKEFVDSHRQNHNTQFILRDLDWFKNNEFYDVIQTIRKNPNWFNLSGWLKDSTQAKLEMYNPIVMSKMFLLHDAKILDKFNSTHMYWIDAGITNTVHPGYFSKDKINLKLNNLFNKFSFICFPYKAQNEIHGFEFNKINEFAESEVKLVGRGGFFGGPKSVIGDLNVTYYSLLIDTLSQGYMGTEESIFSIMLYKHPNLVNYFEIESNGLLNTFFENVKNDKAVGKSITKQINIETKIVKNNNTDKVGLYVIGFNSPNQFKTLIKSMIEYDDDFIKKPQKFLLDNSTDLSTTPDYIDICNEYGFTHIKMENLGICGGRQWIAEHFNSTDLDYMYFFEDDMFFYPKKGEVCKNGFNRYVTKLYSKTLSIIQKENFDFLKLNFTEFFGDNSTQWTWYNVPQNVREQYWPDYNKLPQIGTDPNAPKAIYQNVKSYDGVPYVTGEVYYCNWPQIVSKEGSKKMFLETTWARPFEQTWMSYIFQETKKGRIKPGLLLMTPTEHNRFDHYSRELRKES
jgi:FkbM family methyltransferase